METLARRSNQILIASVVFYVYACYQSNSSSTIIEPLQWSKNIDSSGGSSGLIPDFSYVNQALVTSSSYGSNGQLLGSHEQYYSQQDQGEFMKQHGRDCAVENAENSVQNAFTFLLESLPQQATELFKFCILQHELRKESVHVASFKHAESFLLHGNYLATNDRNIIVVNEIDELIHGSFLAVRKGQIDVLNAMVEFIVNQMERIKFEPFLTNREFYNLIQQQLQQSDSSALWLILKLNCDVSGLTYNCQVQHDAKESKSNKNHLDSRTAILLTPHEHLPYQENPKVTEDSEYVEGPDIESQYITSITTRHTEEDIIRTPNFSEIASSKDCLPTSSLCQACMKEVRGGNCRRCHKFCGCFCDSLCEVEVKEKATTKVFEYKLPLYPKAKIGTRSGNGKVERLIPNIVHQSWFEPITKEKYPNFSRLVQSWNQTNWDHRFYSDEDVEEFLSTHFPPEVRESYDALLPGAFKADLFRYCVLFIHGGVWADIDVLLESKLDMAIDDDVGFIVPLDANPGKLSHHQVCLWNGFMAAAPGHPFLAKVIETVVNNVRNRFTSLDVMNTMCPDVDFYLTHRFDLLFTTGPCILGASVNRFLDRHPQTGFDINATDSLLGDYADKVPGKVVILQANKKDMGSHRFTMLEKNLIIAATDMPDYDDRESVDGHNADNHYSKLRKKGKIYGMSGLYKDWNVANEAIKFEAA